MTAVHEEIYLDAVHESRPAGWLVDDLLFAPLIVASPRPDLEGEARTIAALRDVLTQMDAFLVAGGAARRDVARVTFFMRDVRERPLLNTVWAEWFPDGDDRPPHKYVPAEHAEGVNVAIQVLALLGRRREVLEIPGVQHGDPMSMGAQLGELVTSSRLFGSAPELDDQISLLFERARLLLSGADAELAALTQATYFVGSEEIARRVEERWDEHWSGYDVRPAMHVVIADLGGGNGFPRVEVLALTRGNGDPREEKTQ